MRTFFLFSFSALLFYAGLWLPFAPTTSYTKEESYTPDRIEIRKQLQEKSKAGKPWVIHILVPLCDNDNQGIVKVNRQLGDGLNLSTNLYWGAGYGIRSYFRKSARWKWVKSSAASDPSVLERIIFSRKAKEGHTIYLVADAFRGDRMKESLHAYFQSLSGAKKETLHLDSSLSIPIYGGADLLVFNGHNGLMDDTVKLYRNTDQQARDAAIIACYSHSYFKPYLKASGAYPVVTTTHLLAPEAYVIDGILEKWIASASDEEIRLAAGDAYHSKQPATTPQSARRLFRTGW